MDLRENHKFNVWASPQGAGRQSTSRMYTPWYDMRDYKSIDFLVSAMFEGTTHGQTAAQYTDFQIYKATNSTGGGATAISSATGRITKAGTAITTAALAKSLFINFTTILTDGNVGATFSILGQDFFSANPGASVAGAIAGLSSAAATVAAESFIAVFNTHTSATAWVAEMNGPTCTARAVVRIRPKSETAVGATVYVSASGSSLVPIGVPEMGGHLGIKTELLRDGYRYVALGIQDSASGMTTGAWNRPVSVSVIRSRANDAPVLSTGTEIQFSRSYRATQI